MMRYAALLAMGFAGPALAEAPRVATDIPPVHSLVAMVMEGVGTPELILPPGASPHGYSLRPSEAALLQDADVVFWVGEGLTPWLEEATETLAASATTVELFMVDGTLHLPYRESAIFEISKDHDDHGHDDHDHDKEHDHGDDHAHDHDDDHEEHADAHDHDKDHDHGDDHAHGDDKDHDHGEEHAHGHDEEHEEHADADGHDHGHDHAHDHDGDDPHAWLDPDNAKIWLGAIAQTLSDADPENAARYQANAEAAEAQLSALEGELAGKLSAVGDISFVVYHDAYQYFENRFDAPTRGAISIGDATAPSAARVAELRDLVRDEKIACVFAEPQFNPTLINSVFEEADVQVGLLDPIGADLDIGAGLYPALLTQLADAMASCGSGS